MIKRTAALILKDKKLLVVRKKDTDVFIMPGGKLERNETPEQALARELKEELGILGKNFNFFGTFDGPAIFEEGKVTSDVYFAYTTDQPKPSSEISEYKWIDRNYKQKNIRCGSILEEHVIPRLIEMGLIE